jgi:hypothetical protein
VIHVAAVMEPIYFCLLKFRNLASVLDDPVDHAGIVSLAAEGEHCIIEAYTGTSHRSAVLVIVGAKMEPVDQLVTIPPI